MAFITDAQLLAKKILVTIIIYLIPVTILTGGLILTKHLLSGKASEQADAQTTQTTNPKAQ